MDFTVIIPTKNSARYLRPLLVRLKNFLEERPWEWQVYLSDYGSGDNTIEIFKEFFRGDKRGQNIPAETYTVGEAVRVAAIHAQGEVILFLDPSIDIDFKEIFKLNVWALDQGFDLVAGSREVMGGSRLNRSFFEHLFDHLVSWLVRVLIIRDVKDPLCSFKLVKGDKKWLFSELLVLGPAFEVDLLASAKRKDLKIKEIPIEADFKRNPDYFPKTFVGVIRVFLRKLGIFS